MNAVEFVETVRADSETALSRLGSSKALYAATGGEMGAEAVLGTAVDVARAAEETFAGWAADADGAVAESFAAAAEVEARRAEAVAEELDGGEHDGDVPAAATALRAFEDGPGRAGGYLGWALVTGKSIDQFTGFFVGQADPGTARVFRSFGGDLDEHLERAQSLVETVCDDEADLAAAREAAGEVVVAAYDEYTGTLEALGVNPKPVC